MTGAIVLMYIHASALSVSSLALAASWYSLNLVGPDDMFLTVASRPEYLAFDISMRKDKPALTFITLVQLHDRSKALVHFPSTGQIVSLVCPSPSSLMSSLAIHPCPGSSLR